MRSFFRYLGALWLCLCFIGNSLAAKPYREGEVLVRFKSSGGGKQVMSFSTSKLKGCTVCRSYAGLTQASGGKVTLHLSDKSRTTEELVALFQSDPDVEAVSPNYRKYKSLNHIPNDPDYLYQWGLHNTGANIQGITGLADDDIDWPESRLLSTDNAPEVVIAIIDTGVDIYHDDLRESLWVNPGEIPNNNVDDDGNGFIDDVHGYDFTGDSYLDSNDDFVDAPADGDPSDYSDHGTHVAGIAAATADNGIGVAGVSSAKIMALKIEDLGYDFDENAYTLQLDDAAIVAAMDYVALMKTRGVNIAVVNGSYGGLFYDNVEALAMNDLRNLGIVFCAAAGNEGVNNNTTPQYPASYSSSNVVAVAATNNRDALASFSNYGSTAVDIGAPGDSILSTIPSHLFANASVVQNGSSYPALPLSFTGMTDGITRPFIDCGLGGPADFPPSVNGNIALIERGVYFFYEKVDNAMAAGAVAAVIYNSTADPNNPVNGNLIRPNSWIPSVGIDRPDGQALQALANGINTLTLSTTLDPDGGYDYFDGTSMATPMVAGSVAVLAQHYPNDTLAQRIQRLYDSTEPLPALTGKTTTGGRLNLAFAMDDDDDSVPDWFEEQIIAQTGAANITDTTDTDADGTPDIWEFRAGTDPADPQDAFGFSSTQLNSSGDIQVNFPSADGRDYAIYTTNSLGQPFTLLQDNIAATPPENTVTLPTSGNQQRYFQVILNWPD